MFTRISLAFVVAVMFVALTGRPAEAQTVAWSAGYPIGVNTGIGPAPMKMPIPGQIKFKGTQAPGNGWTYDGFAFAYIAPTAGGAGFVKRLDELGGDLGILNILVILEYIQGGLSKGTYTAYIQASFVRPNPQFPGGIESKLFFSPFKQVTIN